MRGIFWTITARGYLGCNLTHHKCTTKGSRSARLTHMNDISLGKTNSIHCLIDYCRSK